MPLAGFSVVFVLVSAVPETPSPHRVAVLPVILGTADDVTPSLVFRAVRDAAALRPTLSIISIDDYYFHDGGELADRAVACGQDTACISRQLLPFDAQLGLVVIIDLELDPPLESLLLLDRNGTVLRESHEQVAGGASALAARLERETATFFEASGHGQAGRLEVVVEPPGAVIRVNGQSPDRGTGHLFTLSPGPHSVHAALDGYARAEITATVEGGATRTVHLRLEEETSLLRSPWLWTGVGVVVAAGAITAAALLLGSTEQCVCVITADVRTCDICR